MSIDNGQMVLNAFYHVGVFGGGLQPIAKANEVAEELNKIFPRQHLGLTGSKISSKTWQEVHVMLDNQLSNYHNFLVELNAMFS